MLTLAMPQSLPAGRHEPLGLAQVGGEDARRQALRHAVVEGDRLVEVVVGERVQDRRERLGAHDLGLAGHRHDGGSGVERVFGFVGEGSLATGHDLAAVVAGGRQRGLHAVERRGRRSAGRRACPRRAGRRSAAWRRRGRCARRARRGPNGARSDAAATCTAGRPCLPPRTRCRASARSRSADGATIAALLPPSSRIERPKRPATTGATRRPIAVEPVAETIGTASWATSAAPTSAPPSSTWLRWFGASVSAAARSNNALAGDRRERRLVARLPDHRVAAHERERGVPRPHRDREVEGGDDGDRPHRVPRLHQPVPGPLAGDREAVQLP